MKKKFKVGDVVRPNIYRYQSNYWRLEKFGKGKVTSIGYNNSITLMIIKGSCYNSGGCYSNYEGESVSVDADCLVLYSHKEPTQQLKYNIW